MTLRMKSEENSKYSKLLHDSDEEEEEEEEEGQNGKERIGERVGNDNQSREQINQNEIEMIEEVDLGDEEKLHGSENEDHTYSNDKLQSFKSNFSSSSALLIPQEKPKKRFSFFRKRNQDEGDEGSVPSASRVRIVITASLAAFIGPISTTIYNPALPVIRDALGTDDNQIMLTISLYLIISGVMPLIWGPFSDRFGRRFAYIISTSIFSVFSIVCAFSVNIYMLLVFRVLAAVGASSALTVGAGSIADSHPPEIRGKAMGYFLLGPLVGPIVGPSIGGILARYLGWRSNFYFLGGLGLIVLLIIIFCMPETLKIDPASPKKFPKPWEGFVYLKHPGILAITQLAAFSYAAFSIYVISFPLLVTSFYGFDSTQTGFAMISGGVGTMLGSVIGGRVADRVAFNRSVTHRLIVTLAGHYLFVPVLLGLGWTYEIHFVFPIIFGLLNGFCFTFPRPGLTTYAIEVASKIRDKQSASTISGLLYAMMYLVGGIVSQLAVVVIQSIGVAWLFTITGIFEIFVGIPVIIITWKGINKVNKEKKEKAAILMTEANV